MRERFPKIFLCLGILCFALLLLSALVEGPDPAENGSAYGAPAEGAPAEGGEGSAPGSAADGEGDFAVLADVGAKGGSSADGEGGAGPRAKGKSAVEVEGAAAGVKGGSAGPIPCRDANGRVLRAKRYVDSAYQVFRQEAACG